MFFTDLVPVMLRNYTCERENTVRMRYIVCVIRDVILIFLLGHTHSLRSRVTTYRPSVKLFEQLLENVRGEGNVHEVFPV